MLLRRRIRYDRSISCFMMWPAHTNNMLCFVLGCIFKTKFRYERCQLLFCFILLFFFCCNMWTVIKRQADQCNQFWGILIIWVRLKKGHMFWKASAKQSPEHFWSPICNIYLSFLPQPTLTSIKIIKQEQNIVHFYFTISPAIVCALSLVMNSLLLPHYTFISIVLPLHIMSVQ